MEKKIIAKNRKAFHDYFIEETYEAGIVLCGTEIKSLRNNCCNIKDSFVRIENNEAWIYQMHISPYEQGNIFNHDALRIRKLLLHKQEIRKIQDCVSQKGYSVVPLQVYLSGNYVKLEIALVKGKKIYDKRDAIAKKDAQRQIDREMKQSNR